MSPGRQGPAHPPWPTPRRARPPRGFFPPKQVENCHQKKSFRNFTREMILFSEGPRFRGPPPPPPWVLFKFFLTAGPFGGATPLRPFHFFFSPLDRPSVPCPPRIVKSWARCGKTNEKKRGPPGHPRNNWLKIAPCYWGPGALRRLFPPLHLFFFFFAFPPLLGGRNKRGEAP